VVHGPFCPFPALSRVISRRKATSHSLLEGSRMSGKAATMGNTCALQLIAPTRPRTCRRSSRYATRDLTCNVRL